MSYRRQEDWVYGRLACQVAVSATGWFRGPCPYSEIMQIAPVDSFQELFGSAISNDLRNEHGVTLFQSDRTVSIQQCFEWLSGAVGLHRLG